MTINASQLASRINTSVQAAGTGMAGEVGDLAKEYARILLFATQRLNACSALLSKGLRSEALHLLVVEPSVLPIIQAFESAKLQEFEYVCKQQGITLPQRWTPDQLNALRQAVAQEKKLQPLVKKHRLGAMIQAPLPERIATLRELAAADQGNPVWDQDIRIFEAAWISELIASTKRPGGNTLANLQKVLRELTEPDLRSKPTKEQIALIRNQVQKLLTQKLDEETRPVLDRFHHAYLASDPAATSEALQAIADLFAARGVDVPPEISQQTAPAVAWLKHQEERRAVVEQFNNACDRVRQALVDKAPIEDLLALKNQAESFEMDLPDEVLWDLRTAITSQEIRRQRRVRGALLFAILIITGLGVGTSWGMNKHRNDADAARFAADLESAIKAGDINLADQVLDKLRMEASWLAARPEFTPLREELSKLKSAEGARASEFKLLLQEILETPLDQMDAMSVQKLGQLAKTEDDKKRLKEIHEKLNLTFLNDLSALSAQLNTFVTTQAPTADIAESELKLQDFADRLKKIKARPVYDMDASDSLLPVEKQIASTRLALETRIKQIQQQKDQSTRLAEMPAHAKSAIRLAAELDAYAADFPAAGEARSFKAAATQAGEWHAYQQWLILLKNSRPNFTDLGPDEIGARIKDIDAYIREYPQSPVIADANRYLEFLKRADKALAGGGPIRKTFKSFLTNPLISGLSIVRSATGKENYYAVGDGKYKATDVASLVEVVLTDDLTTTTRKEFTPGQIRKPVPSPQTIWARGLIDQITVMRNSEWPLMAASALEQAIQAKDIDPNVQVLLIRAAANMARDTSWGIDAQVQQIQDAALKTPAVTSYWLDPATEDLAEKTAQSEKIVQNARKVTGLQAATRQAMAALLLPLQAEPVGYGVVMGRLGKTQALTTQTDLPDDAVVMAIVPGASDGKLTLRKVGSIVNGKPQLSADSLSSLEEGMMLFFVKPNEVKP